MRSFPSQPQRLTRALAPPSSVARISQAARGPQKAASTWLRKVGLRADQISGAPELHHVVVHSPVRDPVSLARRSPCQSSAEDLQRMRWRPALGSNQSSTSAAQPPKPPSLGYWAYVPVFPGCQAGLTKRARSGVPRRTCPLFPPARAYVGSWGLGVSLPLRAKSVLAFHQLGRLFSGLALAHLCIVAVPRSVLGLSESRNDVAAPVFRLNFCEAAAPRPLPPPLFPVTSEETEIDGRGFKSSSRRPKPKDPPLVLPRS
jgi:hypothetical protein